MTAMDEYTDSAMEADDIFPCKGCGEILEEGKAFELAGHRWHLNCFRCNTCGTLLDSDANLLLLGDGSLICNNCTYSCSACGNKIEDLAILTGDQAFCATCFRCRNCKRKIENLRYARTSQGIFCMSCHESLMARRRKKHKAAAQAKAAREKETSPMITEKSLPALPPSAAGPGSLAGSAVGPSADAPTELSPRPRAAYGRTETSLRSAGSRPDRPDRLDRSPDPSISDASTTKDLSAAVHASVAAASNTHALSPPNYRNNRNSTIVMGGSVDLGIGGDGESFFIPVALDPSPVLTGSSQPRDNARDYFSPPLTESSKQSERSNDAASSHTSTPHIAFQEKSRDADYESRSVTPRDMLDRKPSKSSKSVRSERSTTDDQPQPQQQQQQQQRQPNGRVEEFRLQEAPKSKKAAQRSNSQPFTSSEDGNGSVTPKTAAASANASRRDNPADRPDFSPSTSTSTSVSSTGVRLSQDPRRHDEETSERQSIDSNSLSGSGSAASTAAFVSTLSNRTPTAGIHRKEVAPRNLNSQEKPQQTPQPPPQGRFAMNRPTKLVTSDDTILSPSAIAQHAPPPPLALRPGLQEHKLTDTYMQPRAPPQPPAASPSPAAVAAAQTPSREAVAVGADGNPASPPTGPSPKLPRWSSGGDFSLDEDMARILGTDEGSSSILRRVSNAVRHGRNSSAESSNLAHHSLNGSVGGGSHPAPPRGGPGHNRSISETTRGAASPRWPKTPIVEDGPDLHSSRGISSPISLSSGTPKEDPAFLKRQLRNSEQRVAELERQFGAEKDLKSLNKRLLEKRRTVSVLDTQTEIMIRQLEVLAGYVERAKATNQPIDAKELEDSAIKDFVQRLNDLQRSMSTSIEQLHAERDLLLEEKNQAMADRDRALLEFEQLSSKNAQLADMNNDLTHQIQERFKSQIGNMDQLKSPSIGGGVGGLGLGGAGGNNGGAGGLGIYHSHKGPSISSMNLETASIQTSGGGTLVGTDADESIVESGPTVVNIRKGQVRKFNWKKGSKTVAQGLSKGVNRAVGAFQNERERPPYQGLTGDNIGLPYNMTVASANSPIPFGGGGNGTGMGAGGGGGGGSDGGGHGGNSSNNTGLSSNGHGNGGNGGFGGNGGGSEMGGLQPMSRTQADHAAMMNGSGFGFFKKNSGLPKSNTAASLMSSVAAAAAASASGPVPAEPPSTLFGSELVERADFERRQIPSVVTRCIEEVELRGMDVEGIYRKTGGNSQVKAIQEGFEKHEDFDISDPDLDITAVTSVLKQYFRKLPNPLLTFEVYDRILESASVTDNDERCNHLRKTFNMLPQKHRDCLEFLMFHLSRVANRERENLMSPKNLAVVFAPTIMRDHSLEREMTDMHSKNLAVQFVIENSHIIFSEA